MLYLVSMGLCYQCLLKAQLQVKERVGLSENRCHICGEYGENCGCENPHTPLMFNLRKIKSRYGSVLDVANRCINCGNIFVIGDYVIEEQPFTPQGILYCVNCGYKQVAEHIIELRDLMTNINHHISYVHNRRIVSPNPKHYFEEGGGFCGECGVTLDKNNMWSDFTCKKCAKELGLAENPKEWVVIGMYDKEPYAELVYDDIKVKIPLTYLHELIHAVVKASQDGRYIGEHHQFWNTLEKIEEKMWKEKNKLPEKTILPPPDPRLYSQIGMVDRYPKKKSIFEHISDSFY